MSKAEEPKVIRWMAGVTYTRTETRVSGNRLEFGYTLNGGDFQRTCYMEFDDKKDLADAALTASGLRS